MTELEGESRRGAACRRSWRAGRLGLGRPRRPVAGPGRGGRRTLLGLHPLIVEDILEGNQRAKIETTDGVIHIVLFALDPTATGSWPARSTSCSGSGFLLTVHDADWDPRATHHLRDGPRADPRAAARTTCCGRSATPSSTATSRSPTARRRDRRRPGRGRSSRRHAGVARAAVRAQARAHRDPPAAGPTREVFNQLTNRDLAADRPRGRPLLPRRVRPPHPADRRARQLPRAAVGDARRLPHPGQQQPVGDHEAADRASP